jgi:flagellar basal body-associated protein FliL
MNYMSKKTLTILIVVAVVVVLVAAGVGIHHVMNPAIPMK